MRKMLFAVSVAAALGAIGVSGAGAVPADAMAVKEAATAAAPLQQAQYVERPDAPRRREMLSRPRGRPVSLPLLSRSALTFPS